MRKVIAKAVKHAKHAVTPTPKSAPPKVLIPDPPPEYMNAKEKAPELASVAVIEPDFDSIMAEAEDIIGKLAKCTGATLGTSQGPALIAAAQRWMTDYVRGNHD